MGEQKGRASQRACPEADRCIQLDLVAAKILTPLGVVPVFSIWTGGFGWLYPFPPAVLSKECEGQVTCLLPYRPSEWGTSAIPGPTPGWN
jgi:hypothetical protein